MTANPLLQPDPAGRVSAGSAGAAGQIGAAWRVFRSWRRSRPFWAGALLIIAGVELLLLPLPMHSMGLILHIGVGGVLGILIGAVLIVAGLLLWFNPAQRLFYSIVAVLIAIAALIASNLGGFLLGTLLGVIGGSLGFAWTPLPAGAEARPRRRRTPREPAATPALQTPAEPDEVNEPTESRSLSEPADISELVDPASAGGATDDPDAGPHRPDSARAGGTGGHRRGAVLRGFALVPVLGILAGC
jgi:Family of unknown function (DUF6114)